MYCYKCGNEIPETVKFCPYCGIEQEKIHQKHGQAKENRDTKSFWNVIRKAFLFLIIVPLAVLGLLVVFTIFKDGRDEQILPETTATTDAIATSDAMATTDTMTTTEIEILEDGWHASYGDRYYIEDGQKYVDLHEIDGELYYFDEEGVLVVNKEVQFEGIALQADYDGRIKAITYDAVYGKWAEEDYRFGNGGSSSILELSYEVKNCDSFSFYLESHGEHGAKVNGTWKIYIRCNGKWEFVEKINYSEPKGSFDITFDEPKTFDAITAHPTVQGNASYSSLFYLQNVHCIL